MSSTFRIIVLSALFLAAPALNAQSSPALSRPGKAVFTITFDENGDDGNGPWNIHYQTTYALSSVNEWLRGRDGNRRLPVDLEPGAILRLPVGAEVNFYPLEARESASGQGFTGSRILSSNGGYVLTENDGSRTRTTALSDAEFRMTHGIPSGENFPQIGRYYYSEGISTLKRTATGAVLYAALDSEIRAGGQWGVRDEVASQVYPKVRKFTLTNEELADWGRIEKTNVGSADFEGNNISVTMKLSMNVEPDEIEVSVTAEGYEQWLPKGNIEAVEEPGDAPLKITVTPHRKGDEKSARKVYLTISMARGSKNKGVCVNWPQKSGAEEKEDLRFRAEDFPQKDGLLYKDETHLESDVDVGKTTFRVYSYDFAAWGTVRITATDPDGKPVTVKVRGRDTSDLRIPFDEDNDHIADSWQTANGVLGYDRTWDDVTAPGHTAHGDGLTVWDEYRGVVVVDGKAEPAHKRLNPHEKAHFVIDESNIFDFDRWYRSTGVRAYKLDTTMIAGGANLEESSARRVDFNSSDVKPVGTKYAVRIEVMKGTVEADPVPEKPTPDGPEYSPKQYSYVVNLTNTPRGLERLRIFPDRVAAFIDRMVAAVGAAVDPSAPDQAEQWEKIKDFGMSSEEIQRRIDSLDPAERENLIDRFVANAAIHEMAHACGVKGHTNDKGREDERVTGDKSCPMQYLDQQARRLFILKGELGGDGKLCASTPGDCMKKVNVAN